MRILLVEDNLADVLLVEVALREHEIEAELEVVSDGEAAYSYWDSFSDGHDQPHPDLVLLDINLPRRGGLEVLERIRATPSCAKMNVIIMSSSVNPSDVERARTLGIQGYFRKPTHLDAFLQLGLMIKTLTSST